MIMISCEPGLKAEMQWGLWMNLTICTIDSWGGITIMSLNSVSAYKMQMTIAVFWFQRAKTNSNEDKKGMKFWCTQTETIITL